MQIVKKLWGFERLIINTELYCYKELHTLPGFLCSLHYHKKKDETFYLMAGNIVLEHEGKQFPLVPGDTFRIKPGEKHRFGAVSNPAVLVECSTHDDPEDSYRIEQSRSIT